MMSTRFERPDGLGTEEQESAPANGAGARDGEPDETRVPSADRRVEREESVHLERPETTPLRPRWSEPRGLPERSDVVLDATHLSVNELSLEIEGDLGIKHLRVDTKGLEAQLFLKADLGNVVSLVEVAGRRTPPIVDSARGAASRRDGGSMGRRVAPPAGAALAGLAAGGALAAGSRSSRWIARRAVDRLRGRSALSSFVRGLG
jgi:hypothetical protein